MDEWHQLLRSSYETKELLNQQKREKRWIIALMSCMGEKKLTFLPGKCNKA